MITVRDLIAELIKHDMSTEVCLSIDDPHQNEHGKVQGYVFDIDYIKYEYGALMIKFKDYRSDKKQVCEDGAEEALKKAGECFNKIVGDAIMRGD